MFDGDEYVMFLLWDRPKRKKNNTKAEYIWINVLNTFYYYSKLVILCSIQIKLNVADFS